MRRCLLRAIASAAVVWAALTQTGCLWIPGVATAVVLLTNDDGESPPTPPEPPPEVVLRGPFIPLEGTPADVAGGDFLRREGEDPSPPDVAVLASDRLSVRFFRGDGTGRLIEDVVVSLSPEASLPLGLLVIPDPGSGGDGLVVVTRSSLEYLAFDARSGVPALLQWIPLEFERELREVERGDFNGDGVFDVAVSSQVNERVEIFLGRLEGISLRFDPTAGPLLEDSGGGSPEASFPSPRAIAVANFDADPKGLADLAVLVVETQIPSVKLYLSRGDGRTFGFQDQLAFPDANIDFGAALEAREGATFVGLDDPNPDPLPDLLLNRGTRVSKVLLTDFGDGAGPRLWNYPRATGPSVRSPVSPAMIQLPREPPKKQPPLETGEDLLLWDVVAGDAASNVVSLVYSSAGDGIGNDGRVQYALPGEPQALGVCDLDLNGYEDVVAVSVKPPALTVLLANRPGETVRDDPLFFPFGSRSGENPQGSSPEPVAYGVLDAAGTEPFFVLMEGDDRGIIVIHIDPVTWKEVARERHPQVGSELPEQFGAPQVADLDGAPGDEVLIRSQGGRLYVLRLARPEVPRFQLEPLLDLTDPTGIPSVTCGLSEGEPCVQGPPPVTFRLRNPRVASLDGDGIPDLAIPITVASPGEDDYVVVVLNPLVAPDVTFYATGDDARSVCAANLDGDDAVDLLVACEGDDPERGNRIHVLRGDPEAPGRFLRQGLDGWSIPGLWHPKTGCLDPDCNPRSPRFDPECCSADEMEYIATDNESTGMETRAKVIVVATTTTVQVYFNASRTDALDLVGPCQVYDGVDPEFFVLRDLDGDGKPELILSDEDAESISVCKNVIGFDQPTCINPWEPGRRTIDRVTNSIFALVPAPGGPGMLLACLTANEEIVLYEGGDGAYGFNRRAAIPLETADRVGGRYGLATAPREGSGPGDESGLVVASVVEDLDRQTGLGAVDLLFLPRGTPRSSLRDIGALPPSRREARLLLDGILTPGSVLFPALDDGDSLPDLIVSDDATGEAHWLQGTPRSLWLEDEADASGEVLLDPLWRLERGDALVAWECVDLPEAPGAVLVATRRDVTLLCPVKRRVLWTTGVDGEVIRWVAHGFTDRTSRKLDRLFVAILTDRALEVRAPGSGKTTFLAQGVTGITGCHDLDGDGLDDVVLVDPTAGRLRVFLHERALRFRDPASFEYGSSQDPVDVGFGDLNGDRRPDVCVGMEDGTVHAFLGDGRFRDDRLSAVRLARTYAGPKLEALRLADLDGNRKDEILVSVGTPGLVILTDWSDLLR